MREMTILMIKEKESIELTNKSLYRQIKYYSDKVINGISGPLDKINYPCKT